MTSKPPAPWDSTWPGNTSRSNPSAGITTVTGSASRLAGHAQRRRLHRPQRPDIERTAQSAHNYYRELGELVRDFGNHPPSSCEAVQRRLGPVPDQRSHRLAQTVDPSRLVNQTSGWADRGGSDVYDKHSYPGPDMFPSRPPRVRPRRIRRTRLPVEGHLCGTSATGVTAPTRTVKPRGPLRTAYPQAPLPFTTACRRRIHPDHRRRRRGQRLMTYDRELVKLRRRLAQHRQQRRLPAPARTDHPRADFQR